MYCFLFSSGKLKSLVIFILWHFLSASPSCMLLCCRHICHTIEASLLVLENQPYCQMTDPICIQHTHPCLTIYKVFFFLFFSCYYHTTLDSNTSKFVLFELDLIRLIIMMKLFTTKKNTPAYITMQGLTISIIYGGER